MESRSSCFCWIGEELRVQIQVQPRASQTQWAGIHNGFLKLRLTAAPVDDRANRQCVTFIAKFFQIPKQNIFLLKGRTGRKKTLKILGINPASWDFFLKEQES